MRNIGQDISHELNKADYRQRLEQMRQHVLADPDVQHFLNENKEALTDQAVDRSLSKLYEYVQEKARIQAGKTPKFPNYYPRLMLNVNYIDLEYVPTQEYLARQAERERIQRVSLYQLPKDLHKATFSDFDQSDPGRVKAFEAAIDFAAAVIDHPGEFVKGLYFYGPFGAGKTYLLGAIANYFAERDIPSLLLYYPTFITDLKDAIGDNKVKERIDGLIQTPILVLDDIGAENNTPWTRDEVLGVILQARMSEGRPTLFSSNFDMDALERHFTQSSQGVEPVKAGRVMERVRYLARPVAMSALTNRRYES
ncbi:MAG: primosomal protein DnaI [Aerococcus sp.]|nr:primosomal protein DnaI [Aerococcus sp.]